MSKSEEQTTDGLMSVESVAELLSVSKSLIYQWQKNPEDQQEFPLAVKIPGSKRVLFSKEEIDIYLKWLLHQRSQAPFD